jgi:rhodanese-related sulfurtransferase
MAKTFMQMAEEAMAAVDGVGPEQLLQKLKEDPYALLVDVRDAGEIPTTGIVSGATNISLGMLPVRADLQLPADKRDDRLRDRARPIFATCQLGPNGAIAADRLREMGFTNVGYLRGGMENWKNVGLPTDAV